MKKLTVFTPTYNRSFCLGLLYQSLIRQTSTDFIWMIVDDGSTDSTQELVEKWMEEKQVEIQYFNKQNGGMHTAHNVAYKNIITELNVCIDSDDYMPTDAVSLILNKAKELKEHHAGIIGLDVDTSGKILGSKIPENLKETTVTDFYKKHKATGDKKMVLRTNVVNQFPAYPEYKNEKLVPLGTLYLLIDQKYTWLCTNDVFCVVDYQPDGSSNTIVKQYKKSPRGFAYNRNVKMQTTTSFSEKFKNAIHLVSSAIFANDYKLIFSNPFLFLKILAMPFGVLLNLYIRFKIKFAI